MYYDRRVSFISQPDGTGTGGNVGITNRAEFDEGTRALKAKWGDAIAIDAGPVAQSRKGYGRR